MSAKFFPYKEALESISEATAKVSTAFTEMSSQLGQFRRVGEQLNAEMLPLLRDAAARGELYLRGQRLQPRHITADFLQIVSASELEFVRPARTFDGFVRIDGDQPDSPYWRENEYIPDRIRESGEFHGVVQYPEIVQNDYIQRLRHRFEMIEQNNPMPEGWVEQVGYPVGTRLFKFVEASELIYIAVGQNPELGWFLTASGEKRMPAMHQMIAWRHALIPEEVKMGIVVPDFKSYMTKDNHKTILMWEVVGDNIVREEP